MPLISFIIIISNTAAAEAKTCVESILALQLREEEREIIVVCDGTPISDFSDCQGFADNVIFVRQPQEGVSVARNIGMRIASGQYIQFLDTQCRLFPAAYGHCMDLVRYSNSDIVAFRCTDGTEDQTVYHDSPLVDGQEFLKATDERMTDTTCYVFSAKTARGLLFDRNLTTEAANSEFTTMLLLRAETVLKTDTTAIYRPEDAANKRIDRKDKRLVVEQLDDNLALILRMYDMIHRMPPATQKILKDRIALMTADYIKDVATLTRSRRQTRQRIDTLRKYNLFPITAKGHAAKFFSVNMLGKVI